MRRTLVVVCIGLVSGTVGALAASKEQALPKDLPPYGALKPYTPPPVKEVTLDNGLTVWLAPVSGFPKVAVTLAVKGGISADPPQKAGMAQLLASTLGEGTKTKSAKQVTEAVQGCGGDLSAFAGADSIFVEASALGERAEPLLRVMADVAQNAAFAEDEVKLAKQNSISKLQAQEAQPDFLAQRALYRAVFGSHPYATISPTKEIIAATTTADLRTEYGRRFRPDRALLVVVGDFDSSRLLAAIQQQFGGWRKSAEAGVAQDVAVPQAFVTRTVTYVPRENSVQTELFIGTLGPKLAESDYDAALLANAMFGGMFGSRLVRNIREDKGYTYSPRSTLTTYSATGLLITTAAVRNPVTGASFNEISYELNRIATTAPEDEEVTSAKRFLTGNMAIRLQSQAQLARRLAQYWSSGLKPADLAAESSKIESVTAAQVQAAGRKYFPMARMTAVAVGDEKVIKDELAPFGLELTKSQ